jgi:hypothetical protein
MDNYSSVAIDILLEKVGQDLSNNARKEIEAGILGLHNMSSKHDSYL